MESIKNKLKLLVTLAKVYFLFAIILQVALFLADLPFYTYANFGVTVLDFIFTTFDSGIMGLLFVIFIIIFVSTIIISNKIDKLKTKEANIQTKEQKSKLIYTIIRIVLVANILIAAIGFIKVQGEIEGMPIADDDGYAVYYKGKFVKSITEEQYIQYKKDYAQVTTNIFSSVFLLFTGMIFLSLSEIYRENFHTKNKLIMFKS